MLARAYRACGGPRQPIDMPTATPIRSLTRRRWIRGLAHLLGGPVLHEQVAMWGDIGYWPNIRRPRSMSEKLAWCNLFQRDPRLPILADKLAVREYIREHLGEDHLVPLFAVADRADAIDFDALPNAFVLKATHGCKWVHLVHDKNTEDLAALRARAARWLSNRHGHRTGEWWYAPIPPRLIAEELLTDPSYPTVWEYKVWCFAGRAEMIGVHFDRWGSHTASYFDRQWNQLHFSRGSPPGPALPPPVDFPRLITAAERLAQDFEFVRVDLYQLASGQIKFGELTFCPGAARSRWQPVDWDFRIGELWPWPKNRSAQSPGGAGSLLQVSSSSHEATAASPPNRSHTSSQRTPDQRSTPPLAPAQ